MFVVGTVTEADGQGSCYVTISCAKMIKIIFAIHRRRQDNEVGRRNIRSMDLSFFFLEPPMVHLLFTSECCTKYIQSK